MGDMRTWHRYADRLTPEQRADLEFWDRHPDHPDGEDAHRRGMIRIAQGFIDSNPPLWRRLLWRHL